MSIQVRPAAAGDEGAIVALVQELATSVGGRSPIGEAFARDYLAHPGSHLLLAEMDDRVVGLLSFSVRLDLYHAGPAATIEELVVDGPSRGQGVGHALLAELLRHLASLGCVELAVTVMPDNEGAIRFYRAHGLVDEALLLERHF